LAKWGIINEKLNKMEDIIYKTSDNTLEIRLQFIVRNRLKYTHLGKGWPKHTQCLMYSNGLLDCFETVVKHNKDEDNQVYAYRLVAEKCLKTISNKWLRSQVRLMLNEALAKQNGA
jgi:hypothetical protein